VSAAEAERKEGDPSRIVTAGALALAGGTLAFAAWQVAFRLPQYFEIDYGEGFVWSQVADLIAGRLYRPLSEYPIALMHYTPLYHAVTAVLWQLGLDPLLAGRLVSLCAGFILVATCGVLAYLGVPTTQPTWLRRLAALIAMALAIGTPEVIVWSTLMRVDMLATSLGMLGLVALALSERHRAMLPLAGACFLLAIGTKQSAIAPMVAGAGALLWARPRAGVLLIGGLVATGGAAVIVAELATGGEFLRHTVTYDAARISWPQFLLLWPPLFVKSAGIIAVAMGFAIASLYQAARMRPREVALHIRLTVALSLNAALGLVFTLGMAKVGAGSGYMLPLLAPVVVLAGIAVVSVPRYMRIVLAVLIAQTIVGLATYRFPTSRALAAQNESATQVLQMIHETDGPVLSEDMSLLMRDGRPVPWEFGSINELTRLGLFDDAPLAQRLRDRWFKLVITETWSSQFYTPAMHSAMEQNYQRIARALPFDVWAPREPPAASPDGTAKP